MFAAAVSVKDRSEGRSARIGKKFALSYFALFCRHCNFRRESNWLIKINTKCLLTPTVTPTANHSIALRIKTVLAIRALPSSKSANANRIRPVSSLASSSFNPQSLSNLKSQ